MTFNPECDSRPNRHGLFRIYVRVTENRIKKKIATEIFINSAKHFSTKAKWGNWISSHHPNSKDINKAIINELEKYSSLGLEVNEQKQKYLDLKELFEIKAKALKEKHAYFKTLTSPSNNRKLLHLVDEYSNQRINMIAAYEKIPNFFPPHGALNIHKIVAEYSKKLDYIDFSEKQITEVLELNYNPENLNVFKNFLEFYMKKKEVMDVSVGFIRHVNSKAKAFLSFTGNEYITFNQINRKLITNYIEYLLQYTKSNGEKLKNNSIIDIIQRLSMIFEAAVDEGVITTNPARHIQLPERNQVIRDRLSDEMIERLENLEISRKDKYLWLAQQMFLFSYYNAGIRIGDCINLRFMNISGERLEYSMSKTTKRKSIKLSAKSLAIIEKMRTHYFVEPKDYLFNLLDKDKPYFWAVEVEDRRKLDIEIKKMLAQNMDVAAAEIQAALKELAKLIKHTGRLTFHISRHSFADRARRKMKASNGKISIIDLKNALGHTKIETTERYIESFDKDSLDVAMDAIFD
jgi:integrase/recombinase XerD